MRWCLRVLLTLVLAHAARGEEEAYAIARPFATVAEVRALQASFDAWNTYLPCTVDPSHPVDVFLVYSRDLSRDSEALAAAEGIAAGFDRGGQAWHSCFRGVRLLSANLTAEQDVYDPMGVDSNPNWVSGPNSVFRFVLSYFLAGAFRAFFFMELDSWPQRSGWLHQYLLEASAPGVAIRGSRYRGDNWDSFLPQVPEALREHINGNAVYCVRHPFLRWLSRQLTEEAQVGPDSVAFDVRMAEIVLLSRGTEVWRRYVPRGSDPYLADSKLIGNYANTLLNESFDGGEYIRHMAKSNIFSDLEDARVTLAVSHFSNNNFSTFAGSLETNHPFRKIILLTKEPNAIDGHVDVFPTPAGNTSMLWKDQTRPVNNTFCELAGLVTTEFFVFTDTFHAIAAPVSILMDGDKPLLPFMHATSRYCAWDRRCQASLQQADDLFNVRLQQHYETFDTVFRTELVRSFCADWAEVEANLITRDTDSCLPLLGPTADDYVAWLTLRGRVEDVYRPVNRELKGWRVLSLLHTPHPVGDLACGVYKGAEYGLTAGNISYCTSYIEQADGCQEDARCMWRPIFASGKCIPFVEQSRGWTLAVTATTSTTSLAASAAATEPVRRLLL